MTTEVDRAEYDATTPEELLSLAKHLAADPSLAKIFDRVGLHKPFDRKSGEYRRVVESREAYAPSLSNRPCSARNLILAEALARRLYGGQIQSDEIALNFLSDRIQRSTSEAASTPPLESEIKDIMRNLADSTFIQNFDKYRLNKDDARRDEVDPYAGIDAFVEEQIWIYGLGARGMRIQRIVVSLLNRLWFDVVPDLSSASVEFLLDEPGERLFLHDDEFPRKG